MFGTFMDAIRCNSPYTCPIMAGAGLSTTLAMVTVDWTRVTTQATGAMAVAGLVGGGLVGGVVYIINRYDNLRIQRQKLYDDANKTSLSAQIAESLANQEKMRATLHSLANEAQVAKSENHLLRDDLATLRAQFMDVSKQLRDTDVLLHAARKEMHETAELLRVTIKDRDALRGELKVFRHAQVAQDHRLGALESAGSSDNIPSIGGGPTT